MPAFQEAKLGLLAFTGLPKDALHIYVGLIILFGAALLLRRRVGEGLPLVLVAVAALAGEAWDVIDRWAIGQSADPPAHWHDLWNTMLWPVAITLVARYTRVFRASGNRR